MFKKLSKVLPLFLALLIATAGLACAETETLPADEVVQKTLASQGDIKNLQLAFSLAAEADGVIEGEEVEGSLTLSGTAKMDNQAQSMHANLQVAAAATGPDMPDEPIAAGAEIYVVDEYLYANLSLTDIPDMGDQDPFLDSILDFIAGQWLKIAMTDEITGGIPSMDDIAGLLESSEVEMVGEERIGGVNCYVLSVIPDFEALQEALVDHPLIGQMDFDLSDIDNIEDLISQMSMKVWVAKDTFFIMKAVMELTLELTPEALGQTGEEGDHLNITLTLDMEASQYNKVPTIQVPSNVKDTAIDLSNFF